MSTLEGENADQQLEIGGEYRLETPGKGNS